MSWWVALHYFFQSGFQYGKEVIWTFGPYGFIYARQYFPSTFFIMLLIYSFLTYVYVKIIWDFAKVKGIPAFGAFVAVCIVLFVLCYGQVHAYFDAFFYMGPALLLLVHFLFPRDIFNKYLLIMALACISLVKISFSVPILFIISIIALDSICNQRKTPWFLALYLVAILCFWMGAGQSFHNLNYYLANSVIGISQNYQDAMGVGPSRLGILETLIYILIAILLAIRFFSVISIRTSSGVLFFLGLLVLLWVVFKASFIRHDCHAVMGLTFLPAFSILSFLILTRGKYKKELVLNSLLILFSILSLFIVCEFSFIKNYGGLAATKNNLEGIVHLIIDKDFYSNRYFTIAQQNKLDIQGTVDIYPYDQGPIIVGGLRYQPRPIMQSYSAYSARLSAANADYLKGPQAPNHILFRIKAIDERLPAMDDGASWPEIWSRYSLQDEFGSHLFLKKDRTSKNYYFVPIATVHAKFGEEILVPTEINELLWAKISIQKNLMGNIRSILYRSYPPDIHLKLRDGNVRVFRFLPTVSEGGFLLSPLIVDNKSFASVAATYRGEDVDAVVSFKILPFLNKPYFLKWFFHDDIQIAFYTLEFKTAEH
jgi:hypothetical protein